MLLEEVDPEPLDLVHQGLEMRRYFYLKVIRHVNEVPIDAVVGVIDELDGMTKREERWRREDLVQENQAPLDTTGAPDFLEIVFVTTSSFGGKK